MCKISVSTITNNIVFYRSACTMVHDKVDLPSFITVKFSKENESLVHLSFEKEFQDIAINDDNTYSETSKNEKHSQSG